MSGDLFSPAAAGADFAERAVSPRRELGAYEALWAPEGESLESVAERFRIHEGARPSDFVPNGEIDAYARLALAAIREARIERFGLRVQGAGDYPRKLRDADPPAELLYFEGAWELATSRCVAVVGTREPSDVGKKCASEIARRLAGDGFTVVSGLARGIDTVAHTAAMAAGGFTIAVLGTPITACYPPENRALQRRIAGEHLVVSQVPIVRYSRTDLRRRGRFFPLRNATIAALSEAAVIVEAGDVSGALNLARRALEQRRKVFILDECIRNSALRWPHTLLQRGAIRVLGYDDIERHLSSADSAALS
ncbi:MAG: DNA-processing protein DprA [Steroidobacteraceae bacterium]